MNTRNTWAIAALLSSLLFSSFSHAEVYAPPSSNRNPVSLSSGWKFNRADVANAQSPTFNDQAWSDVNLPHTWNAQDGQDGGGNYYRGAGWYRRHYTVPAIYAGRSLYLWFDGASLTADVYVNGSFAGSHQGGFTSFQLEVTPYMYVGADNVIAVRVSNAYNASIPPLSGDFTLFGGLHRGVYLLATDKVQIRDLPYAGPGVYLSVSTVSPTSANLQVYTRLWNAAPDAKSVTVKSVVVDAAMNIVAQGSGSTTLAASAGQDLAQNLALNQPRLWQGRQDPYLYRVYVEAWDGSRLADLVSQPLGVRSFLLDSDGGFHLNGAYLDLHGVGRHNDRLNKGWAISHADQDEDMSLIKEIGATAVRLAHYPHEPYFYELCDRNGLVVWAEIPLINRITDTTAFTTSARQQLLEMIRQHYNHPSIMFWGLSNEILNWTGPDPRPLISQLAQLARSEDPTRLVTIAENSSIGDSIASYPDAVGYNIYFGWYSGTLNDIGYWADNAHRAFPLRAYAISEFGAGASINQHEDNPAAPVAGGTWHPEEYQNLFHEAYWKAVKTRNLLWGKFVWNMFDFAADARSEGDTPGRNDKGLVTYDRLVKKDAFHWYKANWSNDPVVYITSRRYSPRTTLTNPVKVYSNADSVELVVNQASKGSKTSADRIFLWPAVTFQSGGNVIEARGIKNGKVYTDAVTIMVSSGTQPAASVRIDSGATAGYTDSAGNTFSFDTYYTSGTASSKPNAVAGTSDSLLYQSYRFGNFSYRIPVENGTHQLRLRFAEPYWSAVGARVFNVKAEGQTVLGNFDIFKEAGKFTALDKSSYITVTDGFVDLQFVPVKDNALISAIEVIKTDAPAPTPSPAPSATPLPTSTPAPTVLRYDVGSSLPYTDSLGRVYDKEMNYLGGTVSSKPNAITGTADPTLYRSYRYGNFGYRIPVANATYQVVLKFMEPYWTRAGARVFSVSAEGQVKLANLDIFKEVGQFRAVDKAITVTVNDGTLNLQLTPSVDNAVLSALEIARQ
jgi:beta-galactosidase